MDAGSRDCAVAAPRRGVRGGWMAEWRSVTAAMLVVGLTSVSGASASAQEGDTVTEVVSPEPGTPESGFEPDTPAAGAEHDGGAQGEDTPGGWDPVESLLPWNAEVDVGDDPVAASSAPAAPAAPESGGAPEGAASSTAAPASSSQPASSSNSPAPSSSTSATPADTPSATDSSEAFNAALESLPTSGDIGELVEKMGVLATQVSAKGEEVKQAEEDLGRQAQELKAAEKRASVAQAKAKSAQKSVKDQQAKIDEIAVSRYRGLHLDPLTTTLASGNPQEAVDRLGYMGALSRDARRQLTQRAQASDDATEAQTAADAAVREAAEKKKALEDHKAKLVKEKDELQRQQREIEDRVGALNEEQRAAWQRQFGASAPIDQKLLDMLATSGSGGEAVRAALTRIGAPYVWGATGPDQFDCSGLMVWAYQQQGKTIPRTSQAQLAGGTRVPLDQLKPGDLVGYYPGVTHVGMYIGNGQVVHAPTFGVPVQVVPLNAMPVQGAVRY